MHAQHQADKALLDRLPLPLAQLYRRALNAKSPRDAHDFAYYLWEAGLKLIASAAIVTYRQGDSEPKVDDRLTLLARPSLGHWWELTRLLIPILAKRQIAGYEFIRGMLFGGPRTDLPRSAGLAAMLSSSPSRTTVHVGELFVQLIAYRNKTTGHGAPAGRTSEESRKLADALLLAAAELFEKLDVLAGRRLVFISEVRALPGIWLVERAELHGVVPWRIASLELPRGDGDAPPLGHGVYLSEMTKPDDPSAFVSLQPLVGFDADAETAMILNCRKNVDRVELLCYVTGRLAEAINRAKPGEIIADLPGGSPVVDAPGSPSGGKRIGEYDIISELGRGAMGVVYRAFQPSLNREVALKVQPNAGDAKADARFRREIRALGRVEHPHLVKVYTSGSDGEQFYYTMELVEGAPLAAISVALTFVDAATVIDLPTWKAALASSRIQVQSNQEPERYESRDTQTPVVEPTGFQRAPFSRDVIRHVTALLRQAAEAAHALHEKGIIHRDIKPGNVLITSDGGRAVLMDLGLAQLADDLEGRVTRTRQFVGTLRYASPQQVLAVGKLDRRADVYSLGATLWELLALRPLFGATDETPTPHLMEQIERDEPERLGHIAPSIGRDLEAIVHKCLEKSPDARYATAKDLSDDLERWLDGEPVQARRVSAWEREWKWIKRRPVLSGLSAALIVAIAVGTVASWIMWARAEQNRHLADTRFDQALAAFNDMVFDTQLLLQKRVGTVELRRELLAKARPGLEKLLQDAEAARGADHSLVWSYLKIGEVALELGDTATSRLEYQRGHELAARLARADAKNTQAQRDLSASLAQLGDVTTQLGETATALDYYQQALDVFQRLAEAAPSDSQAQRDLSITFNRLGDLVSQTGNAPAALNYYRAGLEIFQRLSLGDPKGGQAQRDLSASFEKIGALMHRMGNVSGALDHHRQAFEIRQRLAAADPKDAVAQRDVSLSLNNVGELAMQTGNMPLALDYYRQGLEIRERLADADPKNVQAQRDLSVSFECLGLITMRMGNAAAALDYHRRCLEIRERVVEADHKNTQARHELLFALNNLGSVALRTGNTPAALDYYRQAVETSQRLVDTDPQNAQAQRDLSQSLNSLGYVTLQTGNVPKTLEYYRRALKINQLLAVADPTNAQAQSDLSVSFNYLGELSSDMGDAPAALDYHRQCLEIRRRLAAADPKNSQAQRELSTTLTNLGDVALQMNNTASSLDYYHQGLEVLNRLATASPKDAQAQRDLWVSLTKLGVAALATGDIQGAFDYHRRGLEISQRLAGDPKNGQAQRDLCASLLMLGDVTLKTGNVPGALDHYRNCFDIFQRLAAADPKNAQALRDLWVALIKLGEASLRASDAPAALGYYNRSLAISQQLAVDSNSAQAQRDLAETYQQLGEASAALLEFQSATNWYEKELDLIRSCVGKVEMSTYQDHAKIQLAICQKAAKAAGDLPFALSQPASERRGLLDARIRLLARKGDAEGCIATAEAMARLGSTDADSLYSLATFWIICSGASKDNREGYAEKALESLRQAAKAGYKDSLQLKTSKDWEPLHSRDAFNKLVAEMETAAAKNAKLELRPGQ